MYLQLNNLTKKFGNNIVLDNLTLGINRGEILCLLGPSGCGKTTALKIIGGFLQGTSGEVIIDNEKMTNLQPENRPVSTVFQSYALFPHFTVIDNVIYGLKFKGYSKKDALKIGEEYLNIVGLEGFGHRKIQSLSGGQQQRVALARALIVSPKILLLDEPLSNLDTKLRIKMRNEIRQLQKKFNITMIFVTHDQEEALALGDKIAIMNKGKVEQIGTPEEIYNKPSNPFVLDFMGSANLKKEKNQIKSFIRPENIILSKSIGENKGVIEDSIFIGSYTMYKVRVGERILDVKVQNTYREKFHIKEEVFVSFTYEENFS
ncbi:ABC transporter ATP-binding protein [Clostridium frigidicarnis]|uniref:ABC-type quaternary amine transporter n=1 Tax=Clostridium frigidicarnis TaxID=84698 RepID=A0A1I0W8U9_9CLOT|nr:ABC transporter ATP-binding protein [Clostridium frigidicarnis]SFA85122.1 iron(III) transport system ATP-binding protein [Clostridium frigidicarnis]